MIKTLIKIVKDGLTAGQYLKLGNKFTKEKLLQFVR